MTHHTQIKRLLIANRGEIAVRIIKTAKRLGIGVEGDGVDAEAFCRLDDPHHRPLLRC